VLIVIFFFYSYDILYLGILVGIMNLLVTWRLLDPEDYSWMDLFRQNNYGKDSPYMQNIPEIFNPLAMSGANSLAFAGIPGY
jgi:hypothetical protein